ncbi:MAG: glycosyltransferase family 2 protein [Waterburya sp.]
MHITIGILAYNEAESISNILHSLCEQSLLQDSHSGNVVEVIVVCNGCVDNTSSVAKKSLENLAKELDSALFQWEVCEVEEAGKSNAWNLFIHQFADPDANFFFLIDADIKLYAKDTLDQMLDILVQNPEYWISLDQPIKDLELKLNKNFLEKLSVAVSKSSNKDQLYICGQLYCGRASVLRDIWMPAGLPVEDGFLTNMIISENFTIKNPSFKRIVRVTEASHVFEAYTNPLELINHEVRVVVGMVINIFLKDYFREKCNEGQTAGALIAKMNQEKHLWLNNFMRDSLADKGWWVIPIFLVFRRYRSLKNHSLLNAFLRVPIATLAFIVDVGIFIRANKKLHSKIITDYW